MTPQLFLSLEIGDHFKLLEDYHKEVYGNAKVIKIGPSVTLHGCCDFNAVVIDGVHKGSRLQMYATESVQRLP